MNGQADVSFKLPSRRADREFLEGTFGDGSFSTKKGRTCTGLSDPHGRRTSEPSPCCQSFCEPSCFDECAYFAGQVCSDKYYLGIMIWGRRHRSLTMNVYFAD